jgi:hypothetical protein
LNQLQASTNIASIADYGRRFGADQQAEAGMSGLEAMLTGQRAGSELEQEYYKTAAGLFGQQAGGKQGLLGQLLGGGKLSQSVQDQIEAMITGGQGSIF